jgi:hypothetical protein
MQMPIEKNSENTKKTPPPNACAGSACGCLGNSGVFVFSNEFRNPIKPRRLHDNVKVTGAGLYFGSHSD